MKALILLVFGLVVMPYGCFAQKTTDWTFEQLDSLLLLHYNEGNYAAAIPYARQGAAKAKQQFGEADSVHAEYLGNLGFFCYQTGNYKEAEPALVQAADIKRRSLGELHPAHLEALNALASLYQQLNRPEQAEALFLRLIELERRAPELPDYDYSLSRVNLGAFYRETGRLEPAERAFEQAAKDWLSRRPPENDPRWLQYGRLLNGMAMTADRMGKYEQAAALLRNALRIYALYLGNRHPEYAAVLNNLATAYLRTRQYEQAEGLYLQALEIDRKTLGSDHASYAVNCNNLAELYRKMDRDYDAKPLYAEACSVFEKTLGSNHPLYAAALNNRALLETRLRNFEQAEQLYLQAKALRERQPQGKNHPDYANTLNNLGELYAAWGKTDQAERFFLQTLDLRSRLIGTAHPDYIKTLNQLAGLYVQTGNFESASNCLNKALQANCKNCTEETGSLAETPERISQNEFHSPEQLIATLQALFESLSRRSELNQDPRLLRRGYVALQAAITVAQAMRNTMGEERDKLSLSQAMNRSVHQALAAGLALAARGDTAVLAELFAYAEQNKSVLLVDALKGNRAQVLGDLPDSLAFYEQELYRRKDELKKMRYEARTDSTRAKIAAEENRINDQLLRFIESLKGRYPKYHRLKYANLQASADDIRSRLDEQSLFLEYFIAEGSVYLFALSKNDLRILPLPLPADSLAFQIRQLRQALTGYALLIEKPEEAFELYVKPAHWLYVKLLAPALEGRRGLKRLVVVTDGELGHLPFEAFLTKAAPEGNYDYKKLPYLLNDYELTYSYSATLWKENKDSEARLHNGRLLACAAHYGDTLDAVLAERRGAYFTDLRNGLQPLPAARGEVSDLSQRFVGDFWLDEQAGEAPFKAKAGDYGVVHLAMHGLLNRRLPVLSGLAFSEDGDSLQDNFLQSFEIAHLRLNADLVVLSACETGYGNFEQGEGIVSLGRSFMYAGVPSLVVSLWQVNDKSTSLIMSNFYDHLQAGRDKAHALRQAKLDYIAQADALAAHPIFWSAFIQLGDPRPVRLEQSGVPWYLWAAGAALGLLSLGLLLRSVRKR